MLGTILSYAPLLFLVLVAVSGIRIVRPVEKGLIERFGKYKTTAEQGFHWIIPLVDRMIFVTITEIMIDVKPQMIITKDDLNAKVDAVVYYKIKDVIKSVYNVDEVELQIASLARTTLRDIIGKMTLSAANAERDKINIQLEKSLDKQTGAWGVEIVRVELQKIEPPEDVQDSMNNVVKAERDKIAAVNLATAVETEADGKRRADIKVAEGKKKARILEAEGVAQAIKLENEAAVKYFKGNAQILKKLEVTEEALRNNAKVVIPTGTELINVVGEMAGVVPIPTKKQKKDTNEELDEDQE